MSTWGGVAHSWSIATTMEWYGSQMHKQAGSSKVIFLYSSLLSPSLSSSGLPLCDAYTDSSRESRKHITCVSLVPQETQQRGNQTCESTLQRWQMLLGEGAREGGRLKLSSPRVMTKIDRRAVFSCALNFVRLWMVDGDCVWIEKTRRAVYWVWVLHTCIKENYNRKTFSLLKV